MKIRNTGKVLDSFEGRNHDFDSGKSGRWRGTKIGLENVEVWVWTPCEGRAVEIQKRCWSGGGGEGVGGLVREDQRSSWAWRQVSCLKDSSRKLNLETQGTFDEYLST